jgi:serine phosphatase RsbU (regulator of sigma subunit)
MVGNGLLGESPFMFIPANTFFCCLAGLWFRAFVLDPRMKSSRDWIGFLAVCIGGNFLGAVIGVFEIFLRTHTAADTGIDWIFYRGKILSWFAGNTIPSLVLAPALLRAGSSIIVRGPFFCQRFFGGVHPQASMLHHRFNDLPMIAKLLLLIMVVSILPLTAVAGWSILETMRGVDYLAGQINGQAARELRDDVECHELLLRLWTAKIDDPETSPARQTALLSDWRKVPNGFNNLEIIDLDKMPVPLPPQAKEALQKRGITFFPTGRANWWDLTLYGASVLTNSPGKVLTGELIWKEDGPLLSRWAAVEGVLILDGNGEELYGDIPQTLAGWKTASTGFADRQYLIEYGGKKWNVAEAGLPQLGWRFLTLTSIKAGQAAILAKIPNPVAVIINLAIFGSLIIGCMMSRQISDRVLAIAQHVYESGAKPGQLDIPIRGRDELGFLGTTLNRISRELAENLSKLQDTMKEKERLATEMSLAREVQQSILPENPPTIPGYDLAALSNPAREVGGDFFDFIPTAEGKLVMMIGDAVGKGLRAAMFVSETHGLTHAAAIEHDMPDVILNEVNAAIVASRGESSDFVTLFCAVLDPQRHKLFYASAGHNPPIWKHGGDIKTLETGSLPLAIMAETAYERHEIDLAPGDVVVMYTDGVTEAQTTEKELFGTDRLEKVLQNANHLSANEINRQILAAVGLFVGEAPQSDDLTILTLRRTAG